MAASRKWLFKNKFRARAFGWRGSRLAISRLKEAASEIKSVAKSDPVAAGEGTVSLMERIWPAFQDIDTSSGALGTAVARTLNELIPILTDAPADHATRSKWLQRLFEAVQNDGVEYLGPVEERWGEIAHYPDLINEYADRLIEMVRRAWSDHQSFQHVTGTSICLSCLLEAGRYDELQALLATRRTKFWSWHRFGAEASFETRGMGYRDGAEDVRQFRRACAEGKVAPSPSLLLRSAMAEARTISDPAGNAKLCKGSEGGRRMRAKDDASAAAILAVSAGVRAGLHLAPRDGVYLGMV